MINHQKVLAVCASEICGEETQGIIQSVYSLFSKHDWKIIIFSCCSNLSQHTLFDCGEASVFRLMDYDSIDAVLLFKKTIQCREPVNDIISKAHTKKLPLIIVDNENPEEGCINISFSEDEAFTELAKHLTEVHKFTKISILAGHKDNPSTEKRIKIFLDVLASHGIDFNEKTQLGYSSSNSGAVRRELDRFTGDPDNLPEAIVCFSDEMASAACEYLSERGISVPEQITVTGFGGIKQEKYSFPRLTACRCDNDKLAEFIFEKTENFHDNDGAEQEYVFPFSFNVSESCGCHSCSSSNIIKWVNKMYARISDARDYEKTLNNMASKIMTENNHDRIKKILKKHIPFDSYIVMNDDFCSEEQVHHSYKGTPFTDEAIGYRFFSQERFVRETKFERKKLLPDPFVFKEKNEPLIVFPMHNQENVYGYMAAFAEDFDVSVQRMEQLVMSLNTCIFMYEKQYYLSQSNDKLQHIQNKIIQSFADLVESRDDSTGQHIKRTREYVRLLVEHLSKLPKYSRQLTPEVQRRIYEAAPLHDIGKIKISDIILNKPGRLTAEEFEIIKMHTHEGSEIIAKTLTNIENEDYLKTANEMALYHHEKWDGSGYLHHLSGEDIPLSARIMAVVDVFDALTSKRVYKDAFSFDEAIKIISDSSGTHFDPSIIEVFMSIKDEIYTVYEENHTDE